MSEHLKLIQKGAKNPGGAISCFGWKNTNYRLLINEMTGEVLDLYECAPGYRQKIEKTLPAEKHKN